jgi:hypothetical protein
VSADHDRLVDAPPRQAGRRQRATRTVLGPGIKEAPVRDRPPWPQDLAPRAPHEVVPGIVPEPPQRYGTADRLGLGRDQRVDAAAFELTVDLGIGVAGIGGDGRDRRAGRRHGGIDALDHDLPFVERAGRHLDIQDHAAHVVDHGMLLVGRLQPPVAGAGRHGGVGVGGADLLVLAALAADLLRLVRGRLVFAADHLDVANRETLPADVGPDQ